MNVVDIEGLMDTGAYFSLYTLPNVLESNWPLQTVYKQFIENVTLSQIRQSVRWITCVGSEGQTWNLSPYLADIPNNLWGRDLLQEWGT